MLIHLIDVDAMAVLGDLFVSKSSDQTSASAMLQAAGRDLGEPFRVCWSWSEADDLSPIGTGERSSSARVFERQGGGTLDI